MLTIKNIQKAESLEEAWRLNQQKNNRILGGMLWLRLGKSNIQTAIDLSGLGLDTIEETEDAFHIGCMTTLRQLEQHPGLHAYTGGRMKEALGSIVGVQFRNLATVGGSIYGRFGFSDVLTLFLVMDAEVELYQGGRIALRDFAQMPYDNDLLVAIHIHKTPMRLSYQHVRNARTDFPVLTCAVSRNLESGKVCTAIGARPAKALLVEDVCGLVTQLITAQKADTYADYVAAHTPTGSNTRGTAEYRTHLVKVLTRRAVLELANE